MLASHAMGLILLVLVAVAWVGVQIAWRRVFPGACTDPDVLAGRMGCHGPGCSKDCDRRHTNRAGSEEEEIR
jgi:hypothetical protein